MTERKVIIAVIGGSRPDKESLEIAEQVGKLIAQRNAILITGGMGGIMLAASKGAHETNGLVIGILPGIDKNNANKYVDIPIVTGVGEARNSIITRTCDCAIAIDGSYGTLSEIAYCMIYKKVVIGINTWKIDAPIIEVKTAQEAVDRAMKEVMP
ncbi:TIGR00725 family protein [candidate division WOR-3 bacterium]|nr:TIGR00725 family protein [candidate division WOR-3 bacterium]